MTTNTINASSSATVQPVQGLPTGIWATVPPTTQERLQRIEAMGQRINGYVQFMCQLGNLNGTSAEAKEKAVIVFYERLRMVERELGRVQESLRLE